MPPPRPSGLTGPPSTSGDVSEAVIVVAMFACVAAVAWALAYAFTHAGCAP